MITYRKVGGLRFLRIGRLQLSWCICKPKAAPQPKPDNSALHALDGLIIVLALSILWSF